MHIQTSKQERMDLGFGGYQCNWGTHICGLYETPQERDAIILGFLRQGDMDGDLQLYCPEEQTKAEFKAKYSTLCCDSNNHVNDSDCFQIFSAKDLYYPEGTFSPKEMDKSLNSFFEDSQKKGKRNIRAIAEMCWALDAIPGIEHLMIYESRLNYFIKEKPWVSICLYNVTKFDGATIMGALKTHPYTINGGIITHNPFFQDPDIWLHENAPQFLDGERIFPSA